MYVVVKQPPKYHQMTLDEFLSMDTDISIFKREPNYTNTRVYDIIGEVPYVVRKRTHLSALNKLLIKFNEEHKDLMIDNMSELYHTFYLPKKSGGLRRIDAPNDNLSDALRELKGILEDDFGCLYHTSAFAYVKGRSTVDCMKRHQRNNSKWFAKFDLSNFFGSTTKDFVMDMISNIYPFSMLMNYKDGRENISKALDLAFLNGGLPQGTPLSPMLTNIIMIPIDYRISQELRKHGSYVYTRYADDFQISSRNNFNFKEVEGIITGVLDEFNAPFVLNMKKTRYGSSSGSNWNLGIMLNKDGDLTIGNKKKQRFERMIDNYAMDRIHGIKWEINDVQVMEGLRSYYRMIEPDVIDRIVAHRSKKFGVDIVAMIKSDLKCRE